MVLHIRTIAYYTLLEALRNRMAWLILAAAVIGIGLTGFLNELAITESRQVQTALFAAFARFSAVFLLSTFVITSTIREFNDKGLELILALPVPRSGYFFGKLAGFAALATLPALLFGLVMLLLSSPAQAAIWTLSLLLELWLMAAFSLLCVLTFSQVLIALSAAMAFYLMSRSVAALQLIAQVSHGDATLSQQFIHYVVKGISIMMPRLDQFTQTEWVVYHTATWELLPSLLGQSAIYLFLLIGAALFDLYRKNI